MKTIYLKTLSLRNFKGQKKLDLTFDKHDTSIFGANGTGKTTVFDAFTWLLFGKDSTDRKDFNIKTLNADGKSREKLEHSVAATLSVDGKETKLQRIYKEKWTTKNGEPDPEMKGHETLYYIDDVPKKAGDYAKEISEIVDESVFKLITNPNYFPAMKWQDQREILFKIAGTVADEQIAEGNKKITALLEKLQGKKLSDYKTQVAATKRKLKTDLEAIPTRIDEAEKGKPVAFDFAAIENEITQREAEIERLELSIQDGTKANQEATRKNQEIYTQINALKAEQQKVLAKKQQQAYAADAENRKERRILEISLSETHHKIKAAHNRQEASQEQISRIENSLAELRAQWDDEDKKTYSPDSGALVCPVWNITCGDPKSQALHQANQDKARQTFNTKKAEKLAQINAEGKGLSTKKAELAGQIEQDGREIEKLHGVADSLQQQISAIPVIQTAAVKGEELPEWQVIETEIKALEAQIMTDFSDNGVHLLSEQKKQLAAAVTTLRAKLMNRGIIENQDRRIAELNADLKKVAQQISDLEKDEFLIEAFTKAKIDEAENRINSRFSLVKFKLFERQINGADVETCQAMVNGVPYSDANTASKINAGLDIINVLCDFNDVTAPIFIDNRESVSEILETQGQRINLVVNPEYSALTLK